MECVEYVPERYKSSSNAYDNTIGVVDLKADESHQEMENRSETGWPCVRGAEPFG
jgi:hypothetical protein